MPEAAPETIAILFVKDTGPAPFVSDAWCGPNRPSYNPGMFSSVDHIIVAVSDLSAATADYRELLGREPSWRGAHPGQGTANTLFRLGNGYLELLTASGQGGFGDLVRQRIDEAGEGVLGLAFQTADAAACAATLREKGMTPTDPVDGSGTDEKGGAERRWRNVYLPADETRGVMMFAIEHLSSPDALPQAVPTGAEGASVREFDHIVVMTKDADGARGLYGDTFGIRMALDKTFEKFGSRLVFFRLGGMSIEIGASLAEEPDSSAPDSLWGLAYRVPDLAAGQARIADAGLDVSSVRKGRKAGTLVCTVKNRTHGVATLLIGPDPDPAG